MGLPNKGMLLVGAPLAYKQNPQNVVDGQFSGPFVVACGLATGHMGWDSYALLTDPTVRSLLPRIECVEDPEIQALFPTYMAGKLTVRARGQDSSGRSRYPRASRRTSSPRPSCAPSSTASPTRCSAPTAPRCSPTRCSDSIARRTSTG